MVPQVANQSGRMARSGNSLLEVLAASALIGAILVPTLEVMRDAMTMSREIDVQNLLNLYAVSELERQMGTVAANWSNATFDGDFASEGHANIRYTGSRSDALVDGGIPDRLMTLTVTTYDDADGGDDLDGNELQLTMTTKVGKFVTYESAAGS